MKVLVIDDASGGMFAGSAAQSMRELGLSATAMMPRHGSMIELLDKTGWRNSKKLTDEEVLELVREADIIFLDHNMPIWSGEELLIRWRSAMDFDKKRVVGISCDHQPYVEEQFDGLGYTDGIKSFFNMS